MVEISCEQKATYRHNCPLAAPYKWVTEYVQEKNNTDLFLKKPFLCITLTMMSNLAQETEWLRKKLKKKLNSSLIPTATIVVQQIQQKNKKQSCFHQFISDGIESYQTVYERLGETIPDGIFELKVLNGDSFKINVTDKCT